MSCGLPVLSTKCGEPESIIANDQVGILSDFDSFGENMSLYILKIITQILFVNMLSIIFQKVLLLKS